MIDFQYIHCSCYDLPCLAMVWIAQYLTPLLRMGMGLKQRREMAAKKKKKKKRGGGEEEKKKKKKGLCEITVFFK